MKRIGTIAAAGALVVLAAGCEVTVNNKSVDNQVDAAASGLGNLADSAGNAIDKAGDAVENHAEAFGNRIERLDDNVHVTVNVDHDDRKAGNTH